MCLEPFGATGLFILGRGVLLLVGVVTEKGEEEERRGERVENSEEQAKSLLRDLTSAPRSQHCHTSLSEAWEGTEPGRKSKGKTYKDRQYTFPRVKVA